MHVPENGYNPESAKIQTYFPSTGNSQPDTAFLQWPEILHNFLQWILFTRTRITVPLIMSPSL
jgi:hypothetical protein